MAKVKTTLVTFTKDVFPHVKNDVLNIDNDELKTIDSDSYVEGEQSPEPFVQTKTFTPDESAAAAKAAQDEADEKDLADAQAKLDAAKADAEAKEQAAKEASEAEAAAEQQAADDKAKADAEAAA